MISVVLILGLAVIISIVLITKMVLNHLKKVEKNEKI